MGADLSRQSSVSIGNFAGGDYCKSAGASVFFAVTPPETSIPPILPGGVNLTAIEIGEVASRAD
jgi:hypothetical protein